MHKSRIFQQINTVNIDTSVCQIRARLKTHKTQPYQGQGWGGAPPASRRCRLDSGSCRPGAGRRLWLSCPRGSPPLYRPHLRSKPSLSENTRGVTMRVCFIRAVEVMLSQAGEILRTVEGETPPDSLSEI